jgi:hypothetical protein
MIRGLASNYFVELERILDDSLAFCTWALLNDHVASHSLFQSRVDEERLRSFGRLAKHADERGFADVILGDKNTLHPLCRGFAVLADLVERLESEEVSFLRKVADYPEFAQYTQLKSFPFKHTAAFLDLSSEARARLTETLKVVGRDLLESRAPELRNEQLHFRRTATDLERLTTGLRRIESAIHRLESAGLARINFRLVDQQGDEWGRKTFVLADSRNRRIAFARPTPFDWVGLPPLNVEQHLLTEATFAEPNEMLRFTSIPSSKYAKAWNDFPLRRRRSEFIAPVEVSSSGGRGAVGSVQSVQPVRGVSTSKR